ncbi:hypothetical protein DSM106972_013810 [Dulcicalothrix desertica PCC 7102]|uniref:Uncharacterized protein n=1 Tax=Dulcicalothrix desertica PCC 7102 TaxID=232991 RepID=A0A433VPZ4_9CYAN|nr:hypothetical protein DSM106972_013810 [Dulcicalothrix desertica PCC 7102]
MVCHKAPSNYLALTSYHAINAKKRVLENAGNKNFYLNTNVARDTLLNICILVLQLEEVTKGT